MIMGLILSIDTKSFLIDVLPEIMVIFFKYRIRKRVMATLKLLVLGIYLMILPSIKLVSLI
mgnify:CR=1 FL=1